MFKAFSSHLNKLFVFGLVWALPRASDVALEYSMLYHIGGAQLYDEVFQQKRQKDSISEMEAFLAWSLWRECCIVVWANDESK